MPKKIYEAIRHEDGLFAQRANFFLVSQTIFFAAYSQFPDRPGTLRIILITLGSFTALIWLIVAIRNILLIKLLRKEERKILRKKGENPLPKVGWDILSSNNLIGIVFPCIFLIGWLVVILF